VIVIRAQGNKKIVDSFEGQNDALDEVKLPPALVRWANGGYYTPRKEFERIPGKLALSTSTSVGSLLAIKQIDFQDRSVVIVHASVAYGYLTDLSALRYAPPPSSTLMDSFLVP
jgi:hypothetical protein